MKMTRNYRTDLTEKQWRIIQKLLPEQKKTGRKPIDRRRILNAILYLVRTGCQWRNLPCHFPKWKTVYTVFRRWKIDGVWKKIHDALCRIIRQFKGKKPTPSAGIIDSPSADTTDVGGEDRGYDAGKNVSGRKRHILVDTLGLIVAVVVHAASIQDYDGAKLVFATMIPEAFKRMKVIFADSAYGKMGLPDWVKHCFGWVLQTVLRPVGVKGFVVLPKRWIVERTFAWISKYRRHSKDYERNPDSSVAWIHIAMTARMLNDLQHRNINV